MMEKRDNYSVPPGYDGSRFRRRRRNDRDEVVLVPDSGFAPEEKPQTDDSGELSVRGIPTAKGYERSRREKERSDTTYHDDITAAESRPSCSDTKEDESTGKVTEKLASILEKLGFHGGISHDELLICAILFIIATDKERVTDGTGDILLVLALLLGIR